MDASPLAVEWVPTGRLHLNPSNPRHNDPAVPHVAASLQRFGWQQPVVARPSGEVIAGNTRLKAARQLGHERVPVVWFAGSDLDAAAYGVADNRVHEFSTWDESALGEILSVLRAEDAIEGIGYSSGEIDDLLARLDAQLGIPKELDDPGPQEPPTRPVTRPGDLWLLDKHRLLCGDSTQQGDVERLMAGQKAHLCASDPPYLVDYDGTGHPQSRYNRPETRDKHWDQYKDPQSSVAFFHGYLTLALANCIGEVPVYQWHATRRQALVEEAWHAVGLLVHQTVIWVKSRAVLTRSMLMWKHEPCFFGWPQGFMPPKDRRPPHNETTVWEVDQIGQQEGIHPTQKPTLLFERPILWHTKPGEICYEPFAGSATQIIAAEKLGRRCYAMEQAPGFVDASLERWQRATGKQAILDGTQQPFDAVRTEREGSAQEVAR
jgi:DNA modification methylase